MRRRSPVWQASMSVARILQRTWPETFSEWELCNLASYFYP